MINQALDVQKGMDVWSVDGRRIGTVRESWPRTEAYGHVARSMMDMDDYGAVSGTRSLFAGTLDGYVQVQRGGAFRAGRSLFVPFRGHGVRCATRIGDGRRHRERE
jgi:hypothetical protein